MLQVLPQPDSSLSCLHGHFLQVLAHHAVQHFAEPLAGHRGCLHQRRQVVLVETGIHLYQRDALTARQECQGQRGAAAALFSMAQIGQRRVLDEAGRAGAHVIAQGDAGIHQGQGGGINARTVVATI